MTYSSSSSGGGIGFLGVLTIVFIVLKLIGETPIAQWSWWWVLSPLWIPLVIAVALAIIVVGGAALKAALTK